MVTTRNWKKKGVDSALQPLKGSVTFSIKSEGQWPETKLRHSQGPDPVRLDRPCQGFVHSKTKVQLLDTLNQGMIQSILCFRKITLPREELLFGI